MNKFTTEDNFTVTRNTINTTEKEERQYLKRLKKALHAAISKIDHLITEHAKEVKEFKEYLWENKAGMDHAEKVSVRQSVEQRAVTGEEAVGKKNRLRKLMKSPFFGRVDFREQSKIEQFPIYIGIHSYFDEEQKANLIHDWRAPVSSMFYDFEPGEASYQSPTGEVNGEILLKRQYRIRDGEMEFMLESDLNIHDDLLQKELSKASDDKMKNIVATIQRDQNAIIRNESSSTLIIQGVAGSGKTSIALHRIAFLLYRFKENISARDILIISPNKVFADYIANVLPELGEEMIPEKGMEQLASEILEFKFRFQSFFEQVSLLLEKKDEAFISRIQFKATFELLNKLKEYLLYIENNYFQATDIMVKRYPVPAWFIDEKFKSLHRLPLLNRFNRIAEAVEENVRVYYKYEINGAERNQIRKEIKKMFRITNLRQLYKDFYQWLEKPEMFKMGKGSVFEYSDVFPLIYLKIRLEGASTNSKVKHVLVDEMQDYTPVQYSVLALLFPCKKTILGDANQSVNPYSATNAMDIQKVFPSADCVELNKSYRSTFEIIHFAQQISKNDKLEAMERHGIAPEIIQLKNKEEELKTIKQIVGQFYSSGYHSLGIICKNQQQADQLHEYLAVDNPEANLLNAQSSAFKDGVIITTAHLAKGLEFDQVLVPFTSARNYKTEIDKSMLYIACTRAMHQLTLTSYEDLTEFIIK
jgi:DNA helicase II / ATP-dependent DNA helicase PcrA